MENYLESIIKNDDLVQLNESLNAFFWEQLYKDKVRFIEMIEFNYILSEEIGILKIKFLKKFIKKKKTFFKNRYKKPKTELDLLDCLNFDLNFVLSLIKKTIKENDYKYYILSSNREIIDVTNLKKYLRKLDNQNQYHLTNFKEILSKADKIIVFDNTTIKDIEEETNNKGIQNFIDFGDFGFLSLNNNYECKTIIDFEVYNVNLLDEKSRDYFAENNIHSTFQINDFSRKCASVINIITSFLGINDREVFNELIKSNNYLVNEPQQPKYKSEILFKVGLLFANGEMNKYYTINNQNKMVMNSCYSAPKIATELGNNSFDKYILATINGYTSDKSNGNKNIFNSKSMMNNIIEHCKELNIDVIPYFTSRLPIE